MNGHQKHPQPIIRNPAYRQAFQQLDAALEQNAQSDNSEKIRLMRLAMFADVDQLLASGTFKLPEYNHGSQRKNRPVAA